jgi:geranylgeranyl diphosphate synthase type II
MTTGAADATLDERRAEFERALARWLPGEPDVPPELASAMRYSLLGGGKRLRPMLCLAACSAVGGDWRLALPAACALEFIHTYSLIHDDLPAMDDDTMRRGQPTLHVVAGEGMAILAGDGLLTEAFGLIVREPVSTDAALTARKLRVIGLLASAAGAAGMVGGQAIDLACVTPTPGQEPRPALDLTGLQHMHGKKTGALIRASATIGAVMGGARDEVVLTIDEAVAELGLAFQIVDDILDVTQSTEVLGKTAAKDLASNKTTYPKLLGLDASKAEAERLIDEAIAQLGGFDAARAAPLVALAKYIGYRQN